MRVQPLRLGERHGGRADGGQAFAVTLDERAALEEIEDAEAGGEPCAAPRRQHVIGAGDIIADRFRGEPSEENGSGVADPPGEPVGIVEGQFQMLGGEPVDQRRRLVEAVDDDDATVGLPAFPGYFAARQRLQVIFHRFADGVGEPGVVGDQDRLGGGVVLGLGEQVDGDPRRIVGGVGDDQHLRRPGNHIDADGAEHPAFGGGDIGVAGADDLVDRGDRLGAVGQRRNRLGAADAENLVDACDTGGDQNQGVERAAGRRHHHHQPADAGGLGRHRVHQHRGRIGGGAAGHVEADGAHRCPAIAEPKAGVVAVVEIVRHLPGMEGGDPLRREFQRGDRLGRARPGGAVQVRRRNPHGVRRQFEPIKPSGVVDDRVVAAGADVGEDRRHRIVDVGRGFPFGGKHRPERGLEPRIADIKPHRHGRPPGTDRSKN